MNAETTYKLNYNLFTVEEIEDLVQKGEVQSSDIPLSSPWHQAKRGLRLDAKLADLRKQEAEDAQAKLAKAKEDAEKAAIELDKAEDLVAKLADVAQNTADNLPAKTIETIAIEQGMNAKPPTGTPGTFDAAGNRLDVIEEEIVVAEPPLVDPFPPAKPVDTLLA